LSARVVYLPEKLDLATKPFGNKSVVNLRLCCNITNADVIWVVGEQQSFGCIKEQPLAFFAGAARSPGWAFTGFRGFGSFSRWLCHRTNINA
jgi:hypothetical protein